MPGISHRLLHLHVDPSPSTDSSGSALQRFDRKHMVVASRYVADRLADRACNIKLRWLEKLVTLSMTESAYCAAAGAFFESYAHRRIERGGAFQVCVYSSGARVLKHYTVC